MAQKPLDRSLHGIHIAASSIHHSYNGKATSRFVLGGFMLSQIRKHGRDGIHRIVAIEIF
ncbi:MAG: hypothetical protein EOS21_05970 [Mesorhizobium sp.]|uniref:hypothetical protein n=1 Tax=Mesorhizobium sp. TaxID=1871066 RepID=UPI000FEA26C8|nr:hypothetical protein [Mesorhizobium sp.]RWP48641.1 MAG: hypothetical protein EOR05_13335 [Mesorhizobium sp.]RWQ43237.1 MAG: hypothetical protein EOS21_05970 [Mesorhizobium sp.]